MRAQFTSIEEQRIAVNWKKNCDKHNQCISICPHYVIPSCRPFVMHCSGSDDRRPSKQTHSYAQQAIECVHGAHSQRLRSSYCVVFLIHKSQCIECFCRISCISIESLTGNKKCVVFCVQALYDGFCRTYSRFAEKNFLGLLMFTLIKFRGMKLQNHERCA